MTETKDFLGENYKTFKKEVEKLINKYDNGEYINPDIEENYSDSYQFFKFLKYFYELEYVKKLIEYFESAKLTFQNTKFLNETIENLAVTYKSINNFERFFKLIFSDESKNLSIEYESLIRINNSELSLLPENKIDTMLCAFNSKYGKGSCK